MTQKVNREDGGSGNGLLSESNAFVVKFWSPRPRICSNIDKNLARENVLRGLHPPQRESQQILYAPQSGIKSKNVNPNQPCREGIMNKKAPAALFTAVKFRVFFHRVVHERLT